MSNDLISKKTRYEFREYFVEITLREIENEFDAADILLDENYQPKLPGERRSLVEKYYHTLDFSKWSDVRKILIVYENVLNRLEDRVKSIFELDNGEWAQKKIGSLKKWIERDGFRYENGKLIPVGHVIQIPEVSNVAARLDAPELHRQIERMRKAVDDDPSLAVGTAKELVETTCKTILKERGLEFDLNWDIIRLLKETRKVLGLLPDNIPDSAKGSEIIRRLLNNLGTVAQSLGELRNLYGTGHGHEGRSRGLSPRHARLAVGSAATLATFLLETHEERTL